MRTKAATERLEKVVRAAGGDIRFKTNDKVVVTGPRGRAYVGTALGTTASWRYTLKQIERYTGLDLS